MFEGIVKAAITKDLSKDIIKSLKELAQQDVLIGVPQDDSSRGDVAYNATHKKQGSISRGDESINNAELLYIHSNGIRAGSMIREMQPNLDSGMKYSKAHELYVHEKGSPLWHSPPRPVLEPAIENSKEIIAGIMKQIAQDVLNGKDPTPNLHKLGLEGQNAARDWFTNPANGWAPNSEDTIKRKGSANPLIDTGELRKSITYVIRKKGE